VIISPQRPSPKRRIKRFPERPGVRECDDEGDDKCHDEWDDECKDELEDEYDDPKPKR
jgi:hypothetical protein